MGFFRSQVAPEQKGEMVAGFLPGFGIHAAQELINQMPQLYGGEDQDETLELLLELIAFFMHLANRLAFRELGAEQCSAFSHPVLEKLDHGHHVMRIYCKNLGHRSMQPNP